jgi:hypothetical protein
MDGLIEFFKARLDEETAQVKQQPDKFETNIRSWAVIATCEEAWPCTPYLRTAKKRSLADIRARRYILDQYDRWLRETDLIYRTVGQLRDTSVDTVWRLAFEDVVRQLAAVYADHPDYRQEWAP